MKLGLMIWSGKTPTVRQIKRFRLQKKLQKLYFKLKYRIRKLFLNKKIYE